MKAASINSKSLCNILKPNFHLNYGKIRVENAKLNGHSFIELGKLAEDVYSGGIFKRIFVEKADFGIPYVSAQHMMNSNPRENAKIISKRYTPRQNDMILEENQILVSCAGSIGNIRLIDRHLAGVIGSQDIIRIIADESKVSYGFIYAYLSTPTAYNFIQSFIYGSVVPRIDSHTLKKLPVPIISKKGQRSVNKLIESAKAHRAEANFILEKANLLFHKYNEISYEWRHIAVSDNIKAKAFTSTINKLSSISLKAKNHSHRISEILEMWNSKKGTKLNDYISSPYKIGPRGSFKRYDSDKEGVEMVSQGDLHKYNPRKYKRVIVSRKNPEDYAKRNQVLFPAVGNGSSEGEILFRPVLAYKMFETKLLSGDIGRLDCPSLEHAAYLYLVLKSKGGFRIMRSFYYGTQLRRPLWEYLKEINIPIKDEKSFNEIAQLVIQSFDLRSNANENENKAVEIIESEIEEWQK